MLNKIIKALIALLLLHHSRYAIGQTIEAAFHTLALCVLAFCILVAVLLVIF
jgi:hypothetical protein